VKFRTKNSPSEEDAILLMINTFTTKMKEAMMSAFKAGKRGWDDPEDQIVWKENAFPVHKCLFPLEYHMRMCLHKTITERIKNRQYVDAANYLMMLWNLEGEKNG